METPAHPAEPVSLQRLITAVATARSDVLEQLSDAMVVAEHLDRTGDDLIGHFVEQARGQGRSWSAIGHSMGVSKQAAQKRFARDSDVVLEPLDPSHGFARFSVEARNAVVSAHDAARARREPTVSAPRLGLAVADSRLVSGVGVGADRVRSVLEPLLPAPGEAEQELVPYDDEARHALEGSFGAAIRLGADMVGLPHVVLGLLQVEAMAGALAGAGLTPERVESAARDGV